MVGNLKGGFGNVVPARRGVRPVDEGAGADAWDVDSGAGIVGMDGMGVNPRQGAD